MANPIIASLILAGGTAWVGSYFQNRTTKINADRVQRQSELDTAGTIYTEVSTTVDALRFYLIDEAIYVAVRKAKEDTSVGAQDIANWGEYEKALAKWKTSENRLLAQVEVYYGKSVYELLKQIGGILRIGEILVEATYYGTTSSLVKKKGDTYTYNKKKFKDAVEDLPDKIRELNRKMMMLRQKEQVGILRG